jgi:hypothetical protein
MFKNCTYCLYSQILFNLCYRTWCRGRVYIVELVAVVVMVVNVAVVVVVFLLVFVTVR